MEIDDLEWIRPKNCQRETDDEFRERIEGLCCHMHSKVTIIRELVIQQDITIEEYEHAIKVLKNENKGAMWLCVLIVLFLVAWHTVLR